jgi:hypothetical protein
MATKFRNACRALLAGGTLLALGGCDLDVVNPAVIDADTFDPLTDASVLSLSAQSNFYNAFDAAAIRGAYFSGEMWVGAVRQETNDFGRRVITPANLDINTSIWGPLSIAIATNERVVEVLEGVPDATRNINIARSSMNSAFSLVLMAEHFCEGTMLVGPPMAPAELLDSAIVRFNRAIGVGSAVTGAEAAKIVNASRVGLARAYLQKGENAAAIQAAANVPANFVFNAVHVDDPANRGRAGNPLYATTVANSFVVPTTYRALNDPRVPYEFRNRRAADGVLDLYYQLKYPGYAAPVRIASGLEARYITAEAQLKQGNPASALALIAERRTAGNQLPFAGTTPAQILAELMDQRARDFWLEAKHMGDFRRNPQATPYVPAPGTPFYKPSQGNFGDLACMPVPNEERTTNPNWPR